MKVLPVIILISFLLCACGDDARLRRVLDEADRVMRTVPDSAVAMLESMDMGGAPASDRARHALLLTKARRKAHIIETDDSLIRTAVDYYRGRGDSLEVQSLFYNGVIHKFANEYPDALILLMEAYDKACDSGDDFYKAMACREQAAIYTDLYNYDRAAELGREAAETFDKAGMPLHAAWERVYIPQSLAYSGNIDDAYDNVRQLGSDSIIHSDPELQKHFLWIACNVCFEKKDFAQAEKYYDALIAAGDTPSSKLLSQMALSYVENGDIDNARKYHDLATRCQQTQSDTLAALLSLSRIHEAEGDFENAYRLNVNVNTQAYTVMDTLLTHPYTTLINEYYHSEDRRKAALLEEASFRILTWCGVCLALLIFIVCLVYIYRSRMRQRSLEREILISNLTRLEAQIASLSSLTYDDDDKRESTSFPLTLLKSICDWKNTLYLGNNGAEAFGNKVSDLMASLTVDENLKILENYLNNNYDNLMARFRQQAVGLSKHQFDLSIFVFLGFSDSTIACLFHEKPIANPRQMRYRIRKKLKENPTPDTETFLRFF